MMVATQVSDNFDVQSYIQIPHVEDGSTGSPLSILREVLQSAGNLRQAQAILIVEMPFLDDSKAKKQACESLLRSCIANKDVKVLWNVEGLVRLELASLLNAGGETSAARQEFENARLAFESAPVHASDIKFHHYLKVSEVKNDHFASASMEFKAWTELCHEASKSVDFFVRTSATTRAAEAALKIFSANPTDENRKLFWQWQSLSEKLLETAGDVYFMFLGHVTTGVAALQIASNSGAILQWDEEFEAKYPDFDLWDHRIMAKRNLQLIYANLDDEHNRNVFKNAKEINDIMRRKISFWEETDSVQATSSPSQKHDTKDQEKAIPALEDSMPKFAWYSEWASKLAVAGHGGEDRLGIEVGTLTVKSSRVTTQILLRWVQQGVTKGQLSREDVETILMFEKSWDEGVDVYDFLERLTVEPFYSKLFGSLSVPKSCHRWSKAFSVLFNWLMKNQDHHDIKKQYLLLQLQVERMSMMVSSKSAAKDKLIEVERLIEFESTVNEEARFLSGQNTSHWRNIMCSLKSLIYREKHGHVLLDEESPEFQEISELYRISLKEEQQRGRLVGEANTWLLIAQHYFFAAQSFRPRALKPFDEALDNADIAYQKMREGWKNLRGWNRVEKLLSAVEEKTRLSIHPLAMGVIRQVPDSLQESRSNMFWSTVQAAKSIGLGWLMQAYKDESSGKDCPESTARDSDFTTLPTITTEDVQAITDDVGGDVIYVDWYKGSVQLNQMPCPLIVTLSPGQQTQASFVKMSWESIDHLLEKWLKYDESDLLNKDACSLLQQLSPLLEPLSEISKPGQTLVFSATGDLHRVPLHAINLDGEALIRRNPVVYISSLTVLNVVFKARKTHGRTKSSSGHPFKAALFGSPPTPAGTKALLSLSKKLSTKPHTRDDFATYHFTQAIQDHDLDLLHYHSHAEFTDTAPTDQRLLFDNGDLTLSDVFGLAPIPNSYHVTILACGSGMTKTSAVSGEVIGLVPAFLYSGAASTVSTLWPFDDRDAALYTRYFYEGLLKALKEGKSERIDLAKANQAAVVRIMDAKPEMYHWAPFVLNGCWMMDVRGVTGNSKTGGEDVGD